MLRKSQNATALLMSLILVISPMAQAQTQNDDLFPNIPTSSKGKDNAAQRPGITIDESGAGDIKPLPVGNVGDVVVTRPVRPSQNQALFPNQPNQPIRRANPTVGTATNGTNIKTANVPGAYSCPLFENSSYQDLNIAVSSLTNAIQSISDQCKSSQPQLDNIKQTSELIRNSVAQLQGYIQNPQAGYDNMSQMQTNVNSLVSGIDRMSEVFKNITAASSECGSKNLSWGKVALQLNNVVNSASPFLLLLTATQPAISLAVKSAILGTVVGSNVISSMAQAIQSNTADMSDIETQNAVIQNTCQYTKVAKKIRYIQLAQSGRFEQLEKELNDNINTYAMEMTGGSTQLNNLWSVRENIRSNVGNIQNNLRADRDSVNELIQRIRDSQNNGLTVCMEGLELARAAKDAGSFPNTVSNNVYAAFQKDGLTKNVDFSGYQEVFGRTTMNLREDNSKLTQKGDSLRGMYQTLLSRIAGFGQNPKQADISDCAATTMALTQHLTRMIDETSKVTAQDLDKVEGNLLQNEDYRKWKSQFDKITVEKENTARMAKVLKELNNAGAAVYNRSVFAEASQSLKRSLLGTRQGFMKMGLFAGDSPVFAWLNYKHQRFAISIGAFNTSVNDIMLKAYQLTSSGRWLLKGNVAGASTNSTREQLQNDYQAARSLAILNNKMLPKNSPQWDLACIDLEKAVKDYADAMDHLGTTNFMCDMIYDYMDNSIDGKIIKFCRGTTDYSGQQNLSEKSVLEKARAQLTDRSNSRGISTQQTANLMAKKMVEIGCRLPKAAETP